MTKPTPKLRVSQYPTPELSSKGQARDDRKRVFRNLIRGTIMSHKQEHIGKNIDYPESLQTERVLGSEEINGRNALVAVLIPGFLQQEHSSAHCMYVSVGLIWTAGTSTAIENKVQYFCGPLEDVTKEELVIPLETTFTIGRSDPAFAAFVDQRTLSQVQARILIEKTDIHKYTVTIHDGSKEKPSTNGNTVLVPDLARSLNLPSTQSPIHSGIHKKSR